jgi:hypothetical protein
MRARSAFVILCAVMLSGCYPVYKTLRPQASLTVNDQNRRPLVGARVTLVTNFYPYGLEQSRDTVLADSSGIARFSKLKKWETEVMMIHGAKIYFWNWCVQLPGYQTFDSRRIPVTKFEATTVVTLLPGEPTPCQPARR